MILGKKLISMSLEDLSRSKIIRELSHTCLRLGVQAFLVGGVIRDLLLGRPIGKDFDLACADKVEGLAKQFSAALSGHAFCLNDSFGTWRVVIKGPKGRTEVDFSPLQGKNIIDDLRQRDFTINSLALSMNDVLKPTQQSLIDPQGGVADIQKKILRAVSEDSIRHDPLRMMRAFRLSYTLGLSIEESTMDMIQRHKRKIQGCPSERIREELFTTLNAPRSGSFLQEIHKSSLLAEILPEIKGWEDLKISPAVSLWEHALKCVSAAEFVLRYSADLFGKPLEAHFSETIEDGIARSALFKFLALLHDSGKPRLKGIPAEEIPFRFFDHDQEGGRVISGIGRRLKLSRKSIHILSKLTRHHMRPWSLAKAKPLTGRAKYRFFKDLGKEGIEAFCLALANALAKNGLDFLGGGIEKFPKEIQAIRQLGLELLRYYEEEFTPRKPGPLLSGKEIMEALHLPQGKEVGRLLSRLHEAERQGNIGTRAEAFEYLRSEYQKNIDKIHPMG